MAKGYIVTAPLVCVKDEGGAVQYLYRNAPVPSYVKEDVLDDLLTSGMIGETPDPIVPEAPATGMQTGDNPGDFTVAEVQAHLAGADDDEKARVLEAEKAGKNRSSLIPTA